MPYCNDLFYVKLGSGRPVVLLHGNGENHEIFTELSLELAADYQVFAIDSPGHGASHALSRYSYRDMTREIAGLLHEILDEPALIVGFSDGGIIALCLAIDYPTLAAGIIPCGANFQPDGVDAAWLEEAMKRAVYGPDPLLDLMLREPNLTDRELAGIQARTLVCAAEFDLIRLAHTQELAAKIPGAVLKIMPDEDHGSYIEHSTALALPIREQAARIWPVAQVN